MCKTHSLAVLMTSSLSISHSSADSQGLFLTIRISSFLADSLKIDNFQQQQQKMFKSNLSVLLSQTSLKVGLTFLWRNVARAELTSDFSSKGKSRREVSRSTPFDIRFNRHSRIWKVYSFLIEVATF